MKAIQKFHSSPSANPKTRNHFLNSAVITILVIALVALSGCVEESEDPDEHSVAHRVLFAPEDGYQFQQLYNDNLHWFNLVEVDIGYLDFISTSLVYSDTNIEDIPTDDLIFIPVLYLDQTVAQLRLEDWLKSMK